MIPLLVNLLVLCLILGLIWYVVGLLPLPAPFGQIARAIIVVIAILLLVGKLGGYVPPLTERWR